MRTSASITLEALRMAAEAQAASVLAAVDADTSDTARSEARGMHAAFSAIAQYIATQQAENLTDDDVIRQDVTRLRDNYREFWRFMGVIRRNSTARQIVDENLAYGFILLNERVLSSMIGEPYPDEIFTTQQLLGEVNNYLDVLKMQEHEKQINSPVQ